jgi:hypothetical protein
MRATDPDDQRACGDIAARASPRRKARERVGVPPTIRVDDVVGVTDEAPEILLALPDI